MHNEFQSHKGKKQLKIESFLQGKIIKAKKMNNSFLYHNSRMISLQNNGMLVYYSKCFNWPSKEFDQHKKKPKCGIYFNNVYHSCVQNSEREIELIVKFPKFQLYYFENVFESYVKEPRCSDIVLWIFNIPKNNLELNQKFLSVRDIDNFHSFYTIKVANQDEKTQKSISQQVRTEKTTIEQRINNKDFKNKKQVQWLDLQPEKLNHLDNQFPDLVTKSKQFSYDDAWLINEECGDLQMKSMQIQRSSLPCLIYSKKRN
ncbi:unnamed protein product (macronuclear) [Paramecium tetraurelia]|uniref:Uncharacterized protein n=1 Tax=Paramecium tetraurelia TaxID=5888 RepID=A0CYR9_PARTE|nr:uncharacterized protein GSPATT00011537001 [Paramecium tetraurelia]CAK75936.1 unnamed protein product [Paramecium tetraurelia]|eukprot:XP_001443333.1 hypothetical protein (macronuclear) [Paramecium tetraurelia strain d4-2]